MKPKPNPDLDGKTHINVYSKGRTKLGRMLSNFYHAEFTIPNDGTFQSIEGYWYWLSCKNDKLRTLHGYEAKRQGRILRAEDWLENPEFKNKIRQAILNKITQNPDIAKALKASELMLTHYYVDQQNNPIVVNEADWMLEFIEEVRAALKY